MKNAFKIIGIIVVMIAVLILLKMCLGNGGDSISQDAYNSIKDSLRHALSQKDSAKKESSELKKDIGDLEVTVADLVEDMNITRGALIDKSDEAARLAREIKKSKIKRDTVELLAKCDSLADEVIGLQNYVMDLDSFHRKKDEIVVLRIKKSDSLAAHWERMYDGAIRIGEYINNKLEALKPRGKFLIGLTGVAGPVIGAGPAAAYQDKKDKVFQGQVLGTNHGVLYQGTVLVPIGRKR